MTLLSPHSQARRFSATRRAYVPTIPLVSVSTGEIHSNLSVSTLDLEGRDLLAQGVGGDSGLISLEEGLSAILIGHSVE